MEAKRLINILSWVIIKCPQHLMRDLLAGIPIINRHPNLNPHTTRTHPSNLPTTIRMPRHSTLLPHRFTPRFPALILPRAVRILALLRVINRLTFHLLQASSLLPTVKSEKGHRKWKAWWKMRKRKTPRKAHQWQKMIELISVISFFE